MPQPVAAFFVRTLQAAILAAVLLFPSVGPAQPDDPYGDCCVARVTMVAFNAWQATCGSCAVNPGTYPVNQPDPEKLVFVGPGGVSAPSRYEAAAAICQCPSQKARQVREKNMRTFDGK